MLTNRFRVVLLGLAAALAAASAAGCTPGRSTATGQAPAPTEASATTTVAITVSPAPRSSPVFTVVGSMDVSGMRAAFPMKDGRVLVLAGEEPVEGRIVGVLSAFVFDPATGRAAAGGKTTSAHYGAAIAQLQDGRVLVAGGHDGQRAVNTAEIYDPETGVFSRTGSMQFAFQLRSAITLQDGRVLVMGNADGRRENEIYDPKSGRFSRTGSMTIARWAFGATLLEDGRVLVVGGTTPEDVGSPMGPAWTDVTSAEIYDPHSGKFSSTGSMAAAHFGPTLATLGDGRVLVIGGLGPEAELYDPASGTFERTGPLQEARNSCSATVLPDGRVLVAGGQESIPAEGAQDYRVLESTEYFEPTSGTFMRAAPMPTARGGHTAFLMPDGSVLILGGAGGQPGVMVGEEQSQPTVLLANS